MTSLVVPPRRGGVTLETLPFPPRDGNLAVKPHADLGPNGPLAYTTSPPLQMRFQCSGLISYLQRLP